MFAWVMSKPLVVAAFLMLIRPLWVESGHSKRPYIYSDPFDSKCNKSSSIFATP